MQAPFLYIRGLRHADHTVFCVQDGQKTYYDNQFGRWVPYSSGQQVKRSVLDSTLEFLGESQAPITFNKVINDKGGLGEGEPWSPCDPNYSDQLLGGWMRAQAGATPVRRRSPLSISAMRALHPLLSGVTKENLTFDRSSNPDIHPVKVRDANGNELSEKEIEDFLSTNKRSLTRRNFIQDNSRAEGLFVYDIAIDLRTLFSVSLNKHEREITDDIEKQLREKDWKESKNVFGQSLVCPKRRRDDIIKALAKGLVNWRITSNQSRTFSLMETLAITISDNASKIAGTIRAKLSEETTSPRAVPIIDDSAGAETYIALPCDGYIQGAHGTATALEDAEKRIAEFLNNFDYDKQVS